MPHNYRLAMPQVTSMDGQFGTHKRSKAWRNHRLGGHNGAATSVVAHPTALLT